MAEQSRIVSMWDEILENYDEQDRAAFVGGGQEAVERLEAKLGFTLPQEFADYVRLYCPSENLGVAELFQGTSLVSFDGLGEQEYHEGYGLDDLEAGDGAFWLLIAEDNEFAIITDLKNESCPIFYYSGEDLEIVDQLAPNLAHGLYILGYWQRLQSESEAEGDSPEWLEVIKTFQKKLNVLAPGATARSWQFDRNPFTTFDD